jgi:hypothetical protein
MMLFGDLKDGGSLTITLVDGAITLTKKIKQPKVIENESSDVITHEEN